MTKCIFTPNDKAAATPACLLHSAHPTQSPSPTEKFHKHTHHALQVLSRQAEQNLPEERGRGARLKHSGKTSALLPQNSAHAGRKARIKLCRMILLGSCSVTVNRSHFCIASSCTSHANLSSFWQREGGRRRAITCRAHGKTTRCSR